MPEPHVLTGKPGRTKGVTYLRDLVPGGELERRWDLGQLPLLGRPRGRRGGTPRWHPSGPSVARPVKGSGGRQLSADWLTCILRRRCGLKRTLSERLEAKVLVKNMQRKSKARWHEVSPIGSSIRLKAHHGGPMRTR